MAFGRCCSAAHDPPPKDHEPTLISGDVVQNKVVPNIFGDGGTPSSWLAVLDEMAKLGAEHVVPTHSPAGDGSLVAQEKAFIADLRTGALARKQQGMTAEDAGVQLTEEFRKRYPDWSIRDVTSFVRSIYAEWGEIDTTPSRIARPSIGGPSRRSLLEPRMTSGHPGRAGGLRRCRSRHE